MFVALKKDTRRGGAARRLTRAMAVAAACLLSACGRDALVDTDAGAARPPDAPAQLVNPACSGGTWYTTVIINTPVTWPASGGPRLQAGSVLIGAGGSLTIEPGAIVCFAYGAGLRAENGGRLVARGQSSAPIVLTAYDPAQGWSGVSLAGTPPSASQIVHARVEHVWVGATGIISWNHQVFVDSSVVRRSGAGVQLSGANSRFGWSRVDTTTNRNTPAVRLGDNVRFEQSVVRRAAGVGILIDGATGVRLLGGRVEGSGGVGIRAPNHTGIASASLVRVVGGGSYPIETTLPLLQRLYGSTAANQDSLKGNARDSVVMLGGTLNALLYVRMGLPWHVKAPITVDAGGVLAGQSTSALVLDSAVTITAANGGRLHLRGTRTGPVVLTADDPAFGWGGIWLHGAPAQPSYITNAVVEDVAFGSIAVQALDAHAVRVDSAVLRQNGAAVRFTAPGSRLTRSRVDTTTTWYLPAVELAADAVLESTLVRASSQDGVVVDSDQVQIQSCEVRESVQVGIYMRVADVPVHNCNLVDNGSLGILTAASDTDITNNWWGDPAGPWGPNGDGAGNGDYDPWRTTPFVLPYVP